MLTPLEIHNRDVGRLVLEIVKPTLEAGGDFTDVLVILETVILGVILFGVKVGGDEFVLDAVVERVKGRLAEFRLRDMDTEGTA